MKQTTHSTEAGLEFARNTTNAADVRRLKRGETVTFKTCLGTTIIITPAPGGFHIEER